MEASSKVIPAEFYRAFVAYMPIVCVDLLIRRNGKVLLVKRANEPLKGHWWVPGGRILKGETSVDAAKRKAITEVGMDIDPKFVGVYEGRFETSAHNVPTHTVSLVYEAQASDATAHIDQENTAWKWGEVPKRFRDSFSEA